MSAVTLTVVDLLPFAPDISEDKANAMITDALALAAEVAPCILTEEFTKAAVAKAIIRGAVIRWNERGSGALAQWQADAASETYDTKQQRSGLFWPAEIEQLQELCRADGDEQPGAFTVDGIACSTVHAEICSLYFGATYCSCGADIAGYPLYETCP